MKTGLMLAVALGISSFATVAPAAYSDYLQLDGITGESHPPGFLDATRIYSLTVGKNTFSETQYLDSTSPLLLVASSFTNGAIAFYKEPITTTEPYEKILLHDLILSSYQATTVGPHLAEKVSFQFVSPADYLYLALPGVGGSIPIDSLTITDNVFSVHKPVDTTSPTLAAALANGQVFPTSSLLLYTDPASGTPDLSVVFAGALISGIVSDPNGETVSFQATDSTVPEPPVTALLPLGVLAAWMATRCLPARPA
jgi:type VI protein secretion system component Hcp